MSQLRRKAGGGSVDRGFDREDVKAGSALARAVSLHLEGKGREALRELERAAESGESPKEIHAARGHIQFELELYDEAAKSYELLLELEPTSNSAYFNLAVCQEKLGRWAEAAANFQRVVAVDASRLDARLGLGICLLHLKHAEKALECFEICLEKGGEQETPVFGKAVALELMGRQEEAAALYEKILETNPQAEEPMSNLVHIGMRRSDVASVQKWSETLLALRPFSQAALEGLAWCAFTSENYDAASKYCAKLVEQTPDNFERWYNLGVANQKMTRPEQAEKAYAEAAKLKPDHVQAWANLGVVRRR